MQKEREEKERLEAEKKKKEEAERLEAERKRKEEEEAKKKAEENQAPSRQTSRNNIFKQQVYNIA